MGIGPDEAMLFDAVGGVLLDDPGGLILTVYFVWSWPDAIAIVFDRRSGRPVRLAGSFRLDGSKLLLIFANMSASVRSSDELLASPRVAVSLDQPRRRGRAARAVV